MFYIEFPGGLRVISSDMDYMDFIEIGYACGCTLPIYMDCLNVNLMEWLNDEKAEVFNPEEKHSSVCECNEELQGDMDVGIVMDNLQGDMDVGISMDDLQGGIDVGTDMEFNNEPDMDVDNEPDDCIHMNTTKNDEFLSKLCPKVQATPNSPPHEEPYVQMDESEVIADKQATYNDNVYWKSRILY